MKKTTRMINNLQKSKGLKVNDGLKIINFRPQKAYFRGFEGCTGLLLSYSFS